MTTPRLPKIVFGANGDTSSKPLTQFYKFGYGFAHFPASELQKLPIGSAICRVERADNDFNLEVPLPEEMERSLAEQCRLVVVESSRRRVALQERIKSAGIAKGFRSEIEGGTQKGNEGVDVRLIRDDLKIACEVSITTNVDREFGNIGKCLRESFDVIAFISVDQGRRTKMAAEVDAYLAPGDRAKVRD
jgi:hypothetical protein